MASAGERHRGRDRGLDRPDPADERVDPVERGQLEARGGDEEHEKDGSAARPRGVSSSCQLRNGRFRTLVPGVLPL